MLTFRSAYAVQGVSLEILTRIPHGLVSVIM